MKSLKIVSDDSQLSTPALAPGVDFALTASAAKQVEVLMGRERAQKPDVTMLRIGVRGGGCSGLSYVMEFVAESEPKDVLFNEHGVKVCIDPKSLGVLRGTTLDYGQNLSRAGFQWLNPNQKKGCGCGESFAI